MGFLDTWFLEGTPFAEWVPLDVSADDTLLRWLALPSNDLRTLQEFATETLTLVVA